MKIHIKYPSLTNHYRDKEISHWLERYPQLSAENYIVQEKLHGANVQLHIKNGQIAAVGSRNLMIDENTDFMGIRTAQKEPALLDFIAQLQDCILYGELIGSGQKGVSYNVKKPTIRLFDISINGELLPPVDFISITDGYNVTVPVIRHVSGLSAALAMSADFISLVHSAEGNFAEGFVAKPLNKVYKSSESYFMIKKVSSGFRERQKAKKQKRKAGKSEWAVLFDEYINDNRIDSAESKLGFIESNRQMAQYIQYIMSDAKADFLADHPSADVHKSTFSNGGRKAAKLLLAKL